MKTTIVIPGFTAGLVDPLTRTDLAAHRRALSVADNVEVQPLGAVARRAGTLFIDRFEDGPAPRLVPMVFDGQDQFMVALLPGKARVYRSDDGLDAAGAFLVELVIPHAAEDLAGITFAQRLGTLILFHERHAPWRLLWGEDGTWSSEALPITNPPTVDDAGGAAAWGGDHGWPRCGAFFRGRLYLAGSPGFPETLWASRVGAFFDFGLTSERHVDEYVRGEAIGDGANAIRHLTNMDNLLVWTDGGVHMVDGSGAAVTPQNFPLRLMNLMPIIPGTAPAVLEATPIALAGLDTGADGLGGVSLAEFAWNDRRDGYEVQDLALLAPSLVEGAVAVASTRAGAGRSGAAVFVVLEDGTISRLTSLRQEQVTAWTRWRTKGYFLDCAVVGARPWVLARRTTAAGTGLFLERVDRRAMTDCAVIETGDAATTLAAPHLDGVVAHTLADGFPGVAPGADGGVLLDREATTRQAGLGFGWTITTTPLETEDHPRGTLIGAKARVTQVLVRVRETAELRVDGHVALEGRAEDVDGPPAARTEDVEMRPLGGRAARATVTFSGRDPLPAIIEGATFRLEAGE